MLQSIKGTPWQPGATDDVELPEPVTIVPEVPQAPVEPPQPYVRDVQVKRVYITRKTLEKFGYTAGCAACDETKAGFHTGGTQHSDFCRRRIEQAMSEDPREGVRFESAEGDVSEWFLEQEAKRKRREDQRHAR